MHTHEHTKGRLCAHTRSMKVTAFPKGKVMTNRGLGEYGSVVEGKAGFITKKQKLI